MTHRVLIVVSSYAPAMIADMHRARQLAWELPKLGWQVEILTPDSSYQKPFCLDPDSEAFFCPGTRVHCVRPCCQFLFERIGVGSIGWRALLPMLMAGRRLLATGHYDLVYISTTQFAFFLLGSLWQRWAYVPYVLDVHDPIQSGKASPIWAHSGVKHRISHLLGHWIESQSVKGASGLVAVSPAYISTLRQRYGAARPPWMYGSRADAIPFGVLPADLDIAAGVPNSYEFSANGTARIVYVGAGGPIMQRSFRLLCRLLAAIRAETPGVLSEVCLGLFGTYFAWKEGDPCHLAETASELGVSDLVREDPRRVTYRGSLERLLGADGALILGVEDDGYMPSKLFSYAWSGKPLLAVLRRQSPAYALFAAHPELGQAVWFDRTEDMPSSEAVAQVRRFLYQVKSRQTFDRHTFLAPYTATQMARRHVELFRHCTCANIGPT